MSPQRPRCGMPCLKHPHACDRLPGHTGVHRDVQQKGDHSCEWNTPGAKDVPAFITEVEDLRAERDELAALADAQTVAAREAAEDHQDQVKQLRAELDESRRERNRLFNQGEISRASAHRLGVDYRQAIAERDQARAELEPHRRSLTFLTEVITGAALIGADDAISMIRELVPTLVDVDALTTDQAAQVKDGLTAQQAERDRRAEQVKRATDVDLIRLAISDPGAFTKRERFNEGDYETVPAWGARAVMVALRDGRGAL